MFLYNTIFEDVDKRITASYDTDKHIFDIYKYTHSTCGKYTHSTHLMKIKDVAKASSDSLNAEHIIFKNNLITDIEFSTIYNWYKKLYYDSITGMMRNLTNFNDCPQ